nr:MAG TPA: hypothetical protein [Caudoviricetes sp.]
MLRFRLSLTRDNYVQNQMTIYNLVNLNTIFQKSF